MNEPRSRASVVYMARPERALAHAARPEVLAAVARIPATSTGPAAPADVTTLCLHAGHLDLAAELITERATLQDVRARLAAEGTTVPAPAPLPAHAAPSPAAAATTLPITTAQPAPIPQSPAINAAAINARHRTVLAARQPGAARMTPPVAQKPSLRAADGSIDVRAVFKRHNQRGAA